MNYIVASRFATFIEHAKENFVHYPVSALLQTYPICIIDLDVGASLVGLPSGL